MVVVTGMGVIAATGSTLEEYAQCVFDGRSAIGGTGSMGRPSHQDPSGGVIANIPCPANVDDAAWRRWDRAVRMSLVAANEAVNGAGLSRRDMSATPIAVLVGTSQGGLQSQMAYQRALAEGPVVDPSPLMQAPLHAVAEETASFLDLHGPRLTVSNACVSGANCIGLALDLIREGRVDRALCLGVDTFHEFTFTGFASLWALAQEGMRPFDRKRGGMLLGEAAAAVILESDEAARRRKAPIHAEVAGYGLSGDAVHVSAPDRQGNGLARAMTMALEDAGITAAEIDYLNANATGSGYGDASEAQALRKIFGQDVDALPISSVKQITGHTLGAAGILEAIVSVLAIERGKLPPNANLTDLADDCPLGRVLTEVAQVAPTTVLSNSTGFGGATACLVLRRWSQGKGGSS